MYKSILLLFSILILVLSISACEKNPPPDTSVFTLQDEIKLGYKLNEYILNHPGEYPILEADSFGNVYGFINEASNMLISTGNLTYENEFSWDVTILNDDKSARAFSLPGGYVYLSTGLLKYLSTYSEMLSVLGHEMAYADKHLSRDYLAEQFGLTVLVDVSIGTNQSLTSDLINKLLQTAYTSDMTKIADEVAVSLVCPTPYDPSGMIDILARAEAQPADSPLWLTLRPGFSNRAENIAGRIDILNCLGNETGETTYQQFLTTLPE